MYKDTHRPVDSRDFNIIPGGKLQPSLSNTYTAQYPSKNVLFLLDAHWGRYVLRTVCK